jgi:hypothetical protein
MGNLKFSPVNPVVGRLANDVVVMTTIGELALSQTQAAKLAADLAIILDDNKIVVKMIQEITGVDAPPFIPPIEEIERDIAEMESVTELRKWVSELFAIQSQTNKNDNTRLCNQMDAINGALERINKLEQRADYFHRYLSPMIGVMGNFETALKQYKESVNGKD